MANNPETCKEIFSLLSRYLDLDLPQEDCEHIRQHLAGCRPCVEFLESLRKTIALCHTYQPGQAPAPLGEAARTELEAAWRKMVAARRNTTAGRTP